MDALLKRITRPAVIHCEGGDYQAPTTIVVEAHHTLEAPASAEELVGVASADLRALLAITNGATFFDTNEKPDQLLDNGLRIFSTQEMAERSPELRQMIEDAKESLPEEWEGLCEDNDFDLDVWYDGFVPIAAPVSSGDLIVLDTNRSPNSGEPRVLFLDHEFYYGSAFDESFVDWKWSSFREFLEWFAEDPQRLLVSNWRLCVNGPEDQYFPKRIEYRDL